MGFSLEQQNEKMQEKAVRGHYHKVAVGCWFTASGRSIPQIAKYEETDGSLHTLHPIQVLKSEQKYYAGVLSRKYVCRAVVDQIASEFILLYHPESGIWDMVIAEK
ncbi:MAG: hypothetical protein MR966_10650 [Lachnospiraceae bacterium]|nr:hypothetical protein [Lachnospiraceae bacterium]